MKKTLVLLLGLAMLLSLAACAEGAGTTEYKYERYATMTPEAIVAELTLAQKAAQMVQPILYRASVMPMQANGYGSIYGDEGALDAASWRRQVDMYQKAAISSEAGIPYVYLSAYEITRNCLTKLLEE